MPFEFKKFDIPDLMLVQPKVFEDGRGSFAELYKMSDFKEQGVSEEFVQVNQSRSERNVLRGLHYQLAPAAQGKLVSVVEGNVYDVAVDIRNNSPHFGQWQSFELSGDSENMIYVPAGFAHGFLVLSDVAEIIYYCTKEYAPELERGIIWNDQELNIDWPIKDPLLSDKDKEFVGLKEAEINF